MRPGLQSRCAGPFLQPYTVSVPDGDAGTSATIQHMKALAFGPKGVGSWVMRQAAIEAVKGVERGVPEIDSVFNYVYDSIEFRGEYGETLQSPEATLNLGAGDCDDHTTLIGALLASLGFEVRFRTIATHDPDEEYSHVYAEAKDKQTGQWLSLDTTVQASYPGWEPDSIAREATYGTMSTSNSGGLVGRLLSALR